MSCAGKGYGTNPQSNDYLNAQFNSSELTYRRTSFFKLISTRYSSRKCRGYNSFYPSFTPMLESLSVTSSQAGSYSLVYVNGSNFLPNGTTFIKFSGLGYLPVIYYSSFSLSFVVPVNALPGSYDVQVVNLYNGNFSSPINQSYPGNLNFSKSITYTIT
jgi:hypothetical protein